MADLPVYYPTRVGTKWVYLRGGVEETRVVTRAEARAGEKVVTVEDVRKEGNKPYQTVSVRPDGLFLVSESGEAYDPPWQVLKLPFKAGEVWETTTRRTTLRIASKKTTDGEERLKVPAGEFATLRIKSEWSSGVGRAPTRSSYWYAAGVGLVQIDDPPHLVLKSFTPGEE
jgi:hypothetical protein